MIFNRNKFLFFSILSGLLLSAAWPEKGFAPLLFIAWIPLLVIEDFFYHNPQRKSRQLFFLFYLSFLIWNLLTTWWVYNATAFGAAAAIICNSLFMASVFMLFHFTKKKAGNIAGYCSFIFYWVTFEYLHMNWDLSWPWLTLGNGFASYYKWVQWYEYTGTLGGSCWILLINILLFLGVKKVFNKSSRKMFTLELLVAVVVILCPIILSITRYSNYKEDAHPINIAVVQPNIDPYNEKFSGMPPHEQLVKILRLASTVTDSTTDYLVAPETAMPSGIWEEELQNHPDIKFLRSFLNTFPKLTVVIGAATNQLYEKGKPHSATARKFIDAGDYYDSYNTALQLDNFSNNVLTYHKSKLVPGVEKMPFPKIFKYLDKFAIDLGGMSGSLGIEKEPKTFISHDSIQVAPIICYESIYGDYISKYVRKGAQLLFIITNDGWWGETPGYRQHLVYGRLRAIEMRRSIARSANTGISCFINQRGDISQPTKWWKDDAIKETINANDELTFYAQYGDYIAKISSCVSILLIIYTLLKSIQKRFSDD
jgi:apolipoprotein N-acyltransferase